MLKSFFDTVKMLFNLTDDTQKNKADNKALQTKVETVTSTVQPLASEIIADKRAAAEQRENLLLRLENAFMRNEQRALPPGSNAPDTLQLQAQINAMKAEIEELKKQREEMKKR